jgi:asparagine synthase (glutamine-hydrolysing)
MSAIAGSICFDGRHQDRARLEALTAPARGSGTDAVGYWQDEAAALGHALAAVTPDALHEQQPLVDSASGCVIVFDGRLDNRADLGSGLAAYGRLLSRQTDAAYALAGYLHWGEGVPEHLLGDFAFAIWDPRSRQLLLARDPLGTRPCYYSLWDNRVTFASTLEQMLQDLTLPRDLDEAGLVAYLNRDHSLLGRQTCYRHIQSLPGGHRLVAQAGRVQLTKYWHWPKQPPPARPATGADVEEFQTLFTEAVRCRLHSSKPLGLMLSGGLDSSAIACVAGDLQERTGSIQPRTYSMVFDEYTTCDEREYSGAVASRCGLNHTEVPADDCWALSHFPDWLPVFTDPHFLPYHGTHFKVLDAARRDGVRVMLMGHGGDHLLTGSARYSADLLLQGRWRTLREQVSTRARLTNRSFPSVFLTDALAPLAPEGMKRLLRRRPRSPVLKTWMPADLQSPNRPDRRSRGFSGRNAWWYELRSQWDRFGQDPNQAYLDRTLRLFGMELRQPFLDVRLVNFVLRAPPEAVYRNGTTKMLLRDALRNSLPPLVRDRRHRTGVSPLIESGLRQHRRVFVEALLEDSELERRGYVLPGPWKSAVQTFLQGDNRGFWSYWHSLTLEMWLRVQVGRLPELK